MQVCHLRPGPLDDLSSGSLWLPSLSEEQRTTLEFLVAPSEIEATIKSLPNWKSPCHDGYTKAYYSTFFPLFIGPMCSYFDSIAKGNPIPSEALLAHITVLSK